jgi:hypothetical protein
MLKGLSKPFASLVRQLPVAQGAGNPDIEEIKLWRLADDLPALALFER